MPKDAEHRKRQRDAYEAVLKALSVVKIDWAKTKILADLRKELDISEGTYVVRDKFVGKKLFVAQELLNKVLNDPEVKLNRAGSDVGGLREALHEVQRRPVPRAAVEESDNETDTERDEDYRKDEEEEDSFSDGSTSRHIGHRRPGRNKGRSRKRKATTGKRKTKGRMTSQDSGGSGSRMELTNPISHDEVFQYEIGHGAVLSGNGLESVTTSKPPYDKDVFEAYLLHGSLEELKEMQRQVKRRRIALIDVMLDEEDTTEYPEDDLVSMILLREKNVRQMKSLERELNLLRKQG